MNLDKRRNDLTGKEWLQNSFSIWRNIQKTKEEKQYNHPASYPVSMCEKLIKTFSRKGSYVLDPFNGIGSTMKACINVESTGTGIDLSEEFSGIARERCSSGNIQIISEDSLKYLKTVRPDTYDLCVTSPPYWDILNMKRSVDKKVKQGYSSKERDLGNMTEYSLFLETLKQIFTEVYRTLKSDRYCIVNVMDIRKKNKFYPLHSDLADRMKEVGFIYDDLIIWDRQNEYNNMRPLGYPYRFRINKVHEYLMIFLKE
jgi:DNA modification methylase